MDSSNHLALMLDVSSVHVPPQPAFGGLYAVKHKDGWIVFVDENKAVEVPAWLGELHTAAVKADCILINFDKDAPEIPGVSQRALAS